MAHISIPSSMPCEVLTFTPVNPLISKCQIKVCYVGDEPNRNGSVITKDVAREMAKSLPGCPIVGFYNEATGDFEEHNRIIDISNGKFEIKDTTRPYGFVSMDAPVWFQKFLDDGIEHEYLCTEGYIWSEVYPESKRVVMQGNNQSMELHSDVKGEWTENDKGWPEFFIINEALISKLCILGENVEPCFEGAQIKAQFSLSLDEEFKQKVFSMMNELKEVLDKGGTLQMDNELEKDLTPVEEEETEFKKKPDEEEKEKGNEEQEKNPDSKEEEKGENPAAEDEGKDEEEDDEKKKKKEKDFGCGGSGSGSDDKKKKKYSLEEIPEYVELNDKFSKLQADFDTLQEELNSLREFKAAADRKEKQEMIDGFYMLSDEDKKDCIDNIDSYSLNDIEAKLSIICVRNKVSFNLDDDKQDDKSPADPAIYSLGDHDDGDTAPAWIKAVRNTAKKM